MSIRRVSHQRKASVPAPACEWLEERRLLSAGALDPTFGTKGSVTLSFNPPEEYDVPAAVLVQSDQKSIVVGSIQPGFFFEGGKSEIVLARYTTSGKLDSTFGTGGVTIASFTSGDVPQAATLLSDGKMIVAGTSGSNGGSFELSRFTTGGKVDTAFGHSGFVTTTFGDGAVVTAVSIDSQGRILVLGATDLNYNGAFQTSEMTLARYLPNGTLDTTFGHKGTEVFSTGPADAAVGNAMAIQPDGKIVVAGSDGSDFFAARLTPSGALDKTFGGTGVVNVNVKGVLTTVGTTGAVGVAIVAGGNILLGGTKAELSGYSRFELTELTPAGKIDTAFGLNGVVDTSFSQASVAHAMTVEPNGRIVLVGSALDNLSDPSNPADLTLVARYNADGTLDSTFNHNGTVTYDPIETGGFVFSDALAVAPQSNADILVASDIGESDVSVSSPIILARLLG